jgi:hypothetical protein
MHDAHLIIGLLLVGAIPCLLEVRFGTPLSMYDAELGISSSEQTGP